MDFHLEGKGNLLPPASGNKKSVSILLDFTLSYIWYFDKTWSKTCQAPRVDFSNKKQALFLLRLGNFIQSPEIPHIHFLILKEIVITRSYKNCLFTRGETIYIKKVKK